MVDEGRPLALGEVEIAEAHLTGIERLRIVLEKLIMEQLEVSVVQPADLESVLLEF